MEIPRGFSREHRGASRRASTATTNLDASSRRSVRRKQSQESLAEAGELGLTAAADRQQRGWIGGPQSRHLFQRRVVEDHVRRHVQLNRELTPAFAKRLPQRLVVRRDL